MEDCMKLFCSLKFLQKPISTSSYGWSKYLGEVCFRRLYIVQCSPEQCSTLLWCTLCKDEILRYQSSSPAVVKIYNSFTHPTTSNGLPRDEKIGWPWILFSDLLSFDGWGWWPQMSSAVTTWTESKHSDCDWGQHYHSRHPYLLWRLTSDHPYTGNKQKQILRLTFIIILKQTLTQDWPEILIES